MSISREKVEKFILLAGQSVSRDFIEGTEGDRKLGAQLLLSELLEYIIRGLGVVPVVDGKEILDPENVEYQIRATPDRLEMLDGLADVAYTMFWNAAKFGMPLEEAYEAVCENNLTKFIKLNGYSGGEVDLPKSEWGCGIEAEWPAEVQKVSVVKIDDEYFAVGKDGRGKVRKPSTYTSVDLSNLVNS